MSKVGDQLRAMADLYDERNKLYKDNYMKFGRIMDALFPDGLMIKGVKDWNRLGMFVQVMSKQTRYAAQWDEGGHADSMDDTSVYAQMLREVDEMEEKPLAGIDWSVSDRAPGVERDAYTPGPRQVQATIVGKETNEKDSI